MNINDFTYVAPPSINFTEFMDALQKEKGYDYRDFAGKFSKKNINRVVDNKKLWMDKNGYSGLYYVIDKPEGSIDDWPKGSVEMALRIEINSKYQDIERAEYVSVPYQDGWHWLLDNPFSGFNRGGINYLSISYLSEKPDWYDEWFVGKYGSDRENSWYEFNSETPDWMNVILNDIFEACKDHSAFDGDTISFYIDW